MRTAVRRTTLPARLRALFALMLLFGASAAARGDDFEDPESTAWKIRTALTSSQYSQAWQSYANAGYIPIDIESDDLGSVVYSGVWQKNDGRGWASARNLNSTAFHAMWDEYRQKGYRPLDQDAEVLDGKVRYSLVMIENREGLDWKSYRHLTSAELSANFQANRGSYRPVDLDAVSISGVMRYSIIWLENADHRDWRQLRDQTPASYGTWFDDLRKDGFRVVDLDCYSRNGALTYASLWEKNEPGRAWAAYREMTAKRFLEKWRQLYDQGMRVVDVEICPSPSGNGVRYAAVFRENEERYDWKGRKDAAKKVEDFRSAMSAPGVSAAIYSGGKLVFQGAAGYADVETRYPAHGGTIYRIASVAKGITGALAFEMEDAGFLDLTNRTDSFLPELEPEHRHNVLQLVQSTSCVGGYKEVPGEEVNDQTLYSSARAALNQKQDGVLASDEIVFDGCTPGSSFFYSTHGYTLAAAALEVSANRTFPQLLVDRIAGPLKLASLRAETRTSPARNGNLAKLYENTSDGSIKAVSNSRFQQMSWRWGGGGMQSSAVDLAAFGNALLDDRLFPRDVRDRLWDASGASSSFAAGWVVNSSVGERVTTVSKSGGQQGSLSFVRIDVDDDIVVAVMTNRQYPDVMEIEDLTRELLVLALAHP